MKKIKYEDYYVEEITGEYLQVIGGLLIDTEKKGCMVCQEPTKFIDIYSEGRLCSKECDDQWYEELDRLAEVQFTQCDNSDETGV